MTISLEHVREGDWNGLRRIVDSLRSLVVDTGGQSVGIRFGTVTVSTSAAVSGSASVAHGLGTAPVAAFAIANAASGVTNATVTSLAATTFTVAVQYVDGTARTADNTVYWLAVG